VAAPVRERAGVQRASAQAQQAWAGLQQQAKFAQEVEGAQVLAPVREQAVSPLF